MPTEPIVVPRIPWLSEPPEPAIVSPNPYAATPSPAKETVLAVIRELSGELALLGVTDIGLFGSVARGDDGPDSDIDVAVQVPGGDIGMSLRIAKLLEVHCNRRVDLTRLPLCWPLSRTAADDLLMVL